MYTQLIRGIAVLDFSLQAILTKKELKGNQKAQAAFDRMICMKIAITRMQKLE